MAIMISLVIFIAYCSIIQSYQPKFFKVLSLSSAVESLPSIKTSLDSSKPYGRAPSRSYGGEGGSGGDFGRRSSGGGGRGGGRSFNRRPESDSLIQLRFSKTIKIDADVRAPIDDMKFSPRTLEVLKEKGFTEMTPVQTQSYDYVYNGTDVVARSRTGTGKTLAFGIPIIEKLVATGKKGTSGLPLVLILEPTRELALQVAQELATVSRVHGLRVGVVYGGVSIYTQEKDLRNGVHILVATPGRALDHISRGNLDLGNVEHVVLDEGDTMLEMGFQNDVESLIANVKTPGADARRAAGEALSRHDRDGWDEEETFIRDEDDDDLEEALSKVRVSGHGRDVQMLLFSATMPGWICKLTSKHMNDPIFLDAVQEGETRLASTIKHYAVRMPSDSGDRVRTLGSCIEELILTKGAGGQTIVFTNTKDEADGILSSNCFGQLRAQVLHGDISQAGRQATIRQFKNGQIDVLVATDVAARGLDIAGVDLVVHTGPPNDHDSYVHRSGRTGRAGRNGTSVMLYSFSSEARKLEMFERSLNFRFHRTSPPTTHDVARSSAWHAAKKLERVQDDALDYFLPHAKNLLSSLLADEDELKIPHLDEFGPETGMRDDDELSSERVEKLVARFLAALSNKNTIESKSLLTGEAGKLTLQINAVFKNGTSPSNVRDWQRVFIGLLRRSLEMDDVIVGRVAMGRDPTSRQYCGLVDVETSQGRAILKKISSDEAIIPSGIEVVLCTRMPEVVQDNSERSRESYGDRDRDRGSSRGGGYGDRDRDRGRGDRSRSYSDRPGTFPFSRDSSDRRRTDTSNSYRPRKVV